MVVNAENWDLFGISQIFVGTRDTQLEWDKSGQRRYTASHVPPGTLGGDHRSPMLLAFRQ